MSIFNIMWLTVASSGASTDQEYQESIRVAVAVQRAHTRGEATREASERIAAGDKYELMAVCPGVERSSTPN